MFDWQKDNHGGYQAQMPDDVTLAVSPDRFARGFIPKADRGTKWRASASHWCERTRCMSRYGRDEYMNLQGTAKEAMRIAEQIYMDACA